MRAAEANKAERLKRGNKKAETGKETFSKNRWEIVFAGPGWKVNERKKKLTYEQCVSELV